jgi:ubiquinone/menaquinone biosynthesis C-methylase UbiE
MSSDYHFTLSPGGMASARRLLKDTLTDKQDLELLVVGSQFGEIALGIAQEFQCNVTGIEADTEAVLYAKMIAQENKLSERVSFVFMEADRITFPKDKFDAILTDNVFSMFPRKQSLMEFARVLKPGGTVHIMDSYWLKDKIPTFVRNLWESRDNHIPTEEQWKTLISQAGLSCIWTSDNSRALEKFYRQFRRDIKHMADSKFEGMKHFKSLGKQYKHEIDVYTKNGGDKYMGHVLLIAQKPISTDQQ